MAAAIPVIVSFAAAGSAVATAGGVAAALGTVTGFLSVAGAALTAVGAIAKNDKLTKIGGFMGLAGGLGGLATSAAGAGATSAAQEAANAAWSSGGAAEVAGGAGANAFAPAAADAAGKTAVAATEGLGAAGEAAAQAGNAALAPQAAGAGPALQAEPSLFGGSGLNLRGAGDPSVYNVDLGLGQQSALQARGAGLTLNDIQKGASTLWDKAGTALSSTSKFIKDNKELVDIGGSALNAMYGPMAQRIDQLQNQQDFDQSIYRRRMANLNSPVRLNYGSA